MSFDLFVLKAYAYAVRTSFGLQEANSKLRN